MVYCRSLLDSSLLFIFHCDNGDDSGDTGGNDGNDSGGNDGDNSAGYGFDNGGNYDAIGDCVLQV